MRSLLPLLAVALLAGGCHLFFPHRPAASDAPRPDLRADARRPRPDTPLLDGKPLDGRPPAEARPLDVRPEAKPGFDARPEAKPGFDARPEAKPGFDAKPKVDKEGVDVKPIADTKPKDVKPVADTKPKPDGSGCGNLRMSYQAAVQTLKGCSSDAVCVWLVDHDLACPCDTYVASNPNTLASLVQQWKSLGCDKLQWGCIQALCQTPNPVCLAYRCDGP